MVILKYLKNGAYQIEHFYIYDEAEIAMNFLLEDEDVEVIHFDNTKWNYLYSLTMQDEKVLIRGDRK